MNILCCESLVHFRQVAAPKHGVTSARLQLCTMHVYKSVVKQTNG